MTPVVYYEGDAAIEHWVTALLGCTPVFRRLPSSNNSNDFAKLPSYIADILYLDKPDIIISGSVDGIHERPIFSIELAACTPQYQHALQRFSRMLASVTNGCPSILIIPKTKAENQGGARTYSRSQAIDYGAVRLMDIFDVPALVIDWPDNNGQLLYQGGDQLPPLADPGISQMGAFLRSALGAFLNVDYIASLKRLPLTKLLIDKTRAQGYQGGSVPSIASPGGGGAARARLDLLDTNTFIASLLSSGRISAAVQQQLPDYFMGRDKSLVFYPTRLVEHSGDPYVGMLTYYDIAFCRTGRSPRERTYNLIADCQNLSVQEITNTMLSFNNHANGCPFVGPLTDTNLLRYSFHLKNGCSKTKIKPIRIYSELADLVAFSDGAVVSV